MREALDTGRELRVDPYDGQEYTLEEMRTNKVIIMIILVFILMIITVE